MQNKPEYFSLISIFINIKNKRKHGINTTNLGAALSRGHNRAKANLFNSSIALINAFNAY